MSSHPWNVRKAKCADCGRVLLPKEGIRYEMPWYHGRGSAYYLCPKCDHGRKAEQKVSDDPSGVTYE